MIASESRRLERLVADLLDLARLDTHQFSLQPAADRRPRRRRATRSRRSGPPPPTSALALRRRRPGDPAPGFADPQRLAQIVANLVENALKYATDARRRSGVRTVGDRIEIRVDDDGPGIAPDDLPHVFERLYTSRTVPGRIVGTGIGLAIVHELAAAMGGDARVEPIDGEGTRFVVTIPAGSVQPIV